MTNKYCDICIENYNKSTRFKVTCNYCQYSCCRTCFSKCLLNTVLDPHCIRCRKFLTNDFIISNCTQTFIKGQLKQHRTDVLMERERVLLPATQPLAAVEKQKKIVHKEINDLYLERYKLTTNHRIAISNINFDINQRYSKLRNIENINLNGKEQSKFIRKCPVGDCRGFLNNCTISSGNWVCGTCETTICKKCNEPVVDDNHECDPDNVKTMELIKRDTKPCPSCGCMISKISGCDQMFCMECHSAFSWSKGTIEKGVIHNPHYYEFVRNQNNGVIPRNPGDQVCGGLPGIYHLVDLLRSYSIQRTIITNLSNLHRTIVHIQNVEIRNIPNDNVGLRIKYLNNEVSENDFKRTIELNERKCQKFTKLNEINTMFSDVGTELLIAIVNFETKDFKQQLESQLIVIGNLIRYYNEQINKICKFYKCVSPGISTDRYEYFLNYAAMKLI